MSPSINSSTYQPINHTEAFSPVDKHRIHRASKLLTDLRIPICRSIITVMADGAARSVTDIQTHVSWHESRHIEQSTISHHLAKLRRHRTISFTKVSKLHMYTLDIDRLIHINDVIRRFLYT